MSRIVRFGSVKPDSQPPACSPAAAPPAPRRVRGRPRRRARRGRRVPPAPLPALAAAHTTARSPARSARRSDRACAVVLPVAVEPVRHRWSTATWYIWPIGSDDRVLPIGLAVSAVDAHAAVAGDDPVAGHVAFGSHPDVVAVAAPAAALTENVRRRRAIAMKRAVGDQHFVGDRRVRPRCGCSSRRGRSAADPSSCPSTSCRRRPIARASPDLRVVPHV